MTDEASQSPRSEVQRPLASQLLHHIWLMAVLPICLKEVLVEAMYILEEIMYSLRRQLDTSVKSSVILATRCPNEMTP